MDRLPTLLLIAWLLPLVSFTVICIGYSVPQMLGVRVRYATQKFAGYIADRRDRHRLFDQHLLAVRRLVAGASAQGSPRTMARSRATPLPAAASATSGATLAAQQCFRSHALAAEARRSAGAMQEARTDEAGEHHATNGPPPYSPATGTRWPSSAT